MKFIKILFMSCFIFFMLSCKNNNQVQLKNENTRKYNQQKILVSKNVWRSPDEYDVPCLWSCQSRK